ncbi:hypothetical protein [Moorena sp. SIO3F7]|uniref:hypothetical protein n=1 Tax=Moorena sp. SIO3F7 TaxID=2607839 RepID=UPI00140010A5|nr:hypothetical protein [Moorena sp. SIO3F7]NEO15273.1 hypothetical protein [Moorena sp. SIO3E8]NEQ01608.1 hypothetical protein [Moorena sp. SIO3F7]
MVWVLCGSPASEPCKFRGTPFADLTPHLPISPKLPQLPHFPLFPYSLLPTPYSLKPRKRYFTQLKIAIKRGTPKCAS